MNIKINKDQFNHLMTYSIEEYVFGSKLYGTDNENSDTDILVIYKCPIAWKKYINTLPNFHMFQYDDCENNKQFIFTTEDQFVKNQQSGDAIVNSELILFSPNNSDEYKLERCRTYKVIKAFLGFAKRDANNKRYFHANRCLYIASQLLDRKVPCLEDVKYMHSLNNKPIMSLINNFRDKANQLYDAGMLPLYYVPKVEDELLQILLDSNNIKEFKY